MLQLIAEVFGLSLNGPWCESLGSEPKSLRIGFAGHVTEGGMVSSISWSVPSSEKWRRLLNHRSARDRSARRRALVADAVKCTLTGVPHADSGHGPSLVLKRHTFRTQILSDLVASQRNHATGRTTSTDPRVSATASILPASEVQ